MLACPSGRFSCDVVGANAEVSARLWFYPTKIDQMAASVGDRPLLDSKNADSQSTFNNLPPPMGSGMMVDVDIADEYESDLSFSLDLTSRR